MIKNNDAAYMLDHFVAKALVMIPDSSFRTSTTARFRNKVKCQLDATMQFIEVSLARHASGAYARRQEH